MTVGKEFALFAQRLRCPLFPASGMHMTTYSLPAVRAGRNLFRVDSHCHCNESQRPQTILASGLTKVRAEDLLDCLEAQGHTACQVTYVAGDGFLITG